MLLGSDEQLKRMRNNIEIIPRENISYNWSIRRIKNTHEYNYWRK